jgi:AraC family transcriptional regulator, regulatory protein of adaptative response / methylated-DNA-[protein]-cysteine methyltransferase
MNLTRTQMWNAVTARSKADDGRFVFAVKTTKIYCRPSCPSRRPNRENVEFYDSPDQARDAGFRACARCHPDAERSNVDNMVANVRNFIEQNLDQTLTLEKLGTAVGASPYHLQRVFKAAVGLSPREYAEECRMKAVKKELAAGSAVTAALYDAGYSSSSRLYERSSRHLGMTPGAYAKAGKGEEINYTFVNSPLGLLLMAGTERGLCFLQFGTSEKELLKRLEKEFSAARIERNEEALAAWMAALDEYFANRGDICRLPLDAGGTDFQTKVWRYLRQIPAGETRTYSEIAEALGKPTAVRAVARACASNKVALAIPCHRVIRQDGTMGGYRWGIDRKKRLLKDESIGKK